MIELDKRYHKNWEIYDTYATSSAEDKASAGSTAAEQSLEEAARLEQKNILRQLNLAKGRFKKSPSDKSKEQVLSLYAQLSAPADKLTSELKSLGIL